MSEGMKGVKIIKMHINEKNEWCEQKTHMKKKSDENNDTYE